VDPQDWHYFDGNYLQNFWNQPNINPHFKSYVFKAPRNSEDLTQIQGIIDKLPEKDNERFQYIQSLPINNFQKVCSLLVPSPHYPWSFWEFIGNPITFGILFTDLPTTILSTMRNFLLQLPIGTIYHLESSGGSNSLWTIFHLQQSVIRFMNILKEILDRLKVKYFFIPLTHSSYSSDIK
jgi:hypothetical protein